MLLDQCKMRYSKHVTLCNEMRDVPLVHASRIRSPRPTISGATLSLATLSNFSLPPSALTLDAVLPPPPTILNLSLGAYPFLIPSLGARCRLDPGLGARCRRLLPQSLALSRCRHWPRPCLPQRAPPLSSSLELAVVLLLLEVCHHHPLPRSMLLPSSSLKRTAIVDLDPTSLNMNFIDAWSFAMHEVPQDAWSFAMLRFVRG
jgi:hypothetical protein